MKKIQLSKKAVLGQIQVYHGDGKGKSTAALGLAIRAAGQGKNPLSPKGAAALHASARTIAGP